MPTIRIEPQGQTLTAQKGTILRDSLREAGILLDYPCGGKGTCRQCRVAITPAPEGGKGRLSESQAAGGIRLACQLAVEEDCTVTIPEERLSARVWSAGMRDQDIHVEIEPSIKRIQPANGSWSERISTSRWKTAQSATTPGCAPRRQPSQGCGRAAPG